jgi:hypothetical protein
VDADSAFYPMGDESQCCNKVQSCDPPEALKSIWGWDIEGLPKHHTSRSECDACTICQALLRVSFCNCIVIAGNRQQTMDIAGWV